MAEGDAFVPTLRGPLWDGSWAVLVPMTMKLSAHESTIEVLLGLETRPYTQEPNLGPL